MERLSRIVGHIVPAAAPPLPPSSASKWEADAKDLGKAQVLRLRKRHFCPAQSISYENTEPLMIVRGEGCYLIDDQGDRYLDTRNNVNHVGHQNPKVAKAVSTQVKLLNSNTRYLHPNVALLAEKLLSKCPPPLSVVFFVNSGSEANDLALRLADAYSGGGDVVCVERAYHGHTRDVIQISPYKFNGKGGKGKPDWVHVVPCPDTYRGPHRGPNAAEKYANYVRKACEDSKRRHRRVSAFFIESGMSVAGVILPPKGYLKNCYEFVRAQGGVCVADEVQTGFGRFGTSFWGFEQQGVVPDIVTMGKPFGNGMPLAAVVTTRDISDRFANGMEYFNTFGGNPVSAAAGLAVLEDIQVSRLQDRARETGEFIRRTLRDMRAKHPLIGDVRGSGLFCGVEFVRSRSTLEPANAEVSVICSRLKDQFKILTTVDGPFDNVLVIKPPMVFGRAEAVKFLTALDSVLTNLGDIDPNKTSRTPT